jgi:outer membrane protein assembly factor BamD (BamD/ComL family)
LGKRKRITKKSLKHDALVESAAKGTKFVEEHLNKILIGVALVVVVVLVAFMIMRGERAAELQASAALTGATQSLNAGLAAQASQQYQTVIDEYPGTASAGAATCYLGTILYQGGKYDDALQHFENYLTDYKQSPNLHRAALEGKAAVQEQQRAFPDAAATYLKLADEARDVPSSFSRYVLAAVRCYRSADDWQSVLDAANRLTQAYPDAQQAGEARMNAAEAEARLAG